MAEPAVVFQRVSKCFGTVQAIDGLDLAISRGQTVALLGANGAGKSTAVHLMIGLLAPASGQVRVLGQSPRRAVAKGRIGVMLQDGGLMPGISVRAMAGLACRLYARPRPVAQLLIDAQLSEIADRRVDRLSGGQLQRLRFAVAIAGNPEVLVLDEPTAAMDVESRRAFWTSIRRYASGGRTVLFATHYLEEADDNADRIVVLAAGRVVTDGAPAQIKAAAADRRVRFTLGTGPSAGLDLLPGVTAVEIHGSTVTLRTNDTEATLRGLFASLDRIADLEVTGANLEDAVLALTR